MVKNIYIVWDFYVYYFYLKHMLLDIDSEDHQQLLFFN